MAAPGRSGHRQADRPSVRLSACLPVCRGSPWAPGPPLGGQDGKQGREERREGEMGSRLSAALGTAGRGRGDSGTTLGPFLLDVTGNHRGVPAGVEVTDTGD